MNRFGVRIAAGRLKAGFAQQADLAKRLGVSQQTVSRWESGKSRPRYDQVGTIASLLGVRADKLLIAAGYQPKTVVTSFDEPLPIDALPWESFERFARHFIEQRFPEATVHHSGGQGHAQDGIDLEAIFPDGTAYTFQCKRVEEFGPQKIHAAVAKHSRNSKKKFLLLSRPASPHTRDAMATHKDWQLWDKEDISHEFRSLPKHSQLKLVDIFFSGRRRDILGELEPGPWLTSEEFYAPYEEKRSAFNHRWDLVGRSEDIERAQRSLNDPATIIIGIVAPGGAGKSRLLKAISQAYDAEHSAALVRFLSDREQVTNKNLEDLGSGPKLLIVDDAHERSDLLPIFRYAAVGSNETKLLLAYRPYGRASLKAQAGRFALTGQHFSEVVLNRLRAEEGLALAQQALKEYGGPESAAQDLARLTRDCPLATVLGAQVVSKEQKPLQLLSNETVFRDTIMPRFQDVIAGDIGSERGAPHIRKIMRFIALAQPFTPEDKPLLQALEHVEKIDPIEASRIIRLLVDAGVLFRRGDQYRLSPDLLSDYIIENACVSIDGGSTGYAERVFDAVNGAYLEHLMINLARLDWRRNDGKTKNSRLLGGVWAKLNPQSERHDSHLDAITAIAFYHPERTLRFVREQMERQSLLGALPNILKFVGYNLDHLGDVCELLWKLGRDDVEDENPYSEKAIKILDDFCQVTRNKPIEFIETTVAFGIALAQREGAWIYKRTPFDFLKGGLVVDCTDTEPSGKYAVRFNLASVSWNFAKGFRKKIIDLILEKIRDKNNRAATSAAKLLSYALHYPRESERSKWNHEFASTLKAVRKIIRENSLSPGVLIAIIRSISWHANYGPDVTALLADQIFHDMPKTLEFRTVWALVDGHGLLFEKIDDVGLANAELAKLQTELAVDLLRHFPDAENLRCFVNEALVQIAGQEAAPFSFMRILIHQSSEFAEAVARNALSEKPDTTARYAPIALGAFLKKDGARAQYFVEAFLSGGLELQADLGYAYAQSDLNSFDDRDVAVLRQIIGSQNPPVVTGAIAALRGLIAVPPEIVIDLVSNGNIGLSAKLADEALMLFHSGRSLLRFLDGAAAQRILDRLKPLPELQGHWIEKFLSYASEQHAKITAQFFMERVEWAANQNDWSARPCNHGPFGHVPLRFTQSPDFITVLRSVLDWMISKADAGYKFNQHAADLFGTMFSFEADLMPHFANWIDVADQRELDLIGRILREAPNDFVFRERTFVLRYLERCQGNGDDCYGRASSRLFASAVSGMRSGSPGEPFPQDLLLRDNAHEALASIPRFTSGYKLYSDLLRYAEERIDERDSDDDADDE